MPKEGNEELTRANHTAISFVSAATEIVFAIGAEEKLVGVTSLCDYPPEARSAPRCIVCRSMIDASKMTSEEVDAAMKAMRQRTGSKEGPGLWCTDDDSIKKISPKVVFVQSACEICDPRQDDVLLALRRTGLLHESGVSNGVNVVTVSATTLEGMFLCIDKVAIALDLPQNGIKLSNELRRRLNVVQTELSKDGNDAKKPSVLSLEGLSPLCTGGNWLPDIKAAAGCQDAFGEEGGANARIVTWNEVMSADPDVLVLCPCSSSPKRTLDELHVLSSEPAFWKLRCVQNGEVYIIDHNRFSRPGPRLVSGVEMLASLLRGIPPPPGAEKEWTNEILKLNGNTLTANEEVDLSNQIRHLASWFESPFTPTSLPKQETKMVRENAGLTSYAIEFSVIPNKSHPETRSAHCMIRLPEPKKSGRNSLFVFSGESKGGSALNDAWKIHLPAEVLISDCAPDASLSCLFRWEYLGKSVSSVADEDVPSIRSNSAATVCGPDHLLVFGGWGQDNCMPLSACELLHLETLCWTHCSTRGSMEPPPRGNPTLVYSSCNNKAILFGGWDRVRRLDDLWSLDLNKWEWTQLQKFRSDANPSQAITWPRCRTDHSAVIWRRNESAESMIVYGGSVEGDKAGASEELWFLDCSHNGIERWKWEELAINGPCPSGRTSHSAAIVGTGETASMIVLGGTDVSKGSGKTGIVGDAWILTNLGLPGKRCWIKLPWEGSAVERCRHTMTLIDSSLYIWGGWDGEGTVDDTAKLWRGSLDHLLESEIPICLLVNDASSTTSSAIVSNQKINAIQNKASQERWEAEIPFREEDLPTEILKQALRSKLPNALARAMHRHAVLKCKDTYIDPSSGYSVFTQLYLKRRPCCGNACRHCPHGHQNVPDQKNNSINSTDSEISSGSLFATALDW